MSLKNLGRLGGTNKLLLICLCMALPITVQAQESPPTEKPTAGETNQQTQAETTSEERQLQIRD